MPRILKQLRAIGIGVWVPLALIVVLNSLPATSVTAQTIVVADEDFQNDVETMGPGNGTSPPQLLGPPGDDVGQPGQWVANGYAHTNMVDTNPNLNIATGFAVAQNAPFIPSAHASKTSPDDFLGYPRSEGTNFASQGGILKFADASGAPVVANAGDTIVGEFHFWLEGGNFQFAMVSDITTLKAEQAAHSWDGITGISAGDTPILAAGGPVDMPSAHTGGDYYEGIGGLITHRPGSNNETHAVIENLADPGQLIPTKLEDDIAKSYNTEGVPPRANESWQLMSFEYTVGNDFWDNLSVTKYTSFSGGGIPINPVTEELRVLSDASAVPFSATGNAPTALEGIVFGAGDGSTVRWWLDEIYIEVQRLDATDMVWTGNNDSDWNDGQNWNPLSVPNATNDNVTLDAAGGGGTAFIDSAVTVKSITIDHTAAYAIAGTNTLTLEADAGNAALTVAAGPQGAHELQVDILSLASNTDVNVGVGATLDIDSQVDLNGNTLTIQTGTVSLNDKVATAGSGTVVNDATLTGGGTINGDLDNNGTLIAEIFGTGPFDINGLDITGIATLDGLLDIAGGFTPTSAGPYTVLTAGSITASPTLALTVAADLIYDLSFTANSVLLTATVVANGDFDGSGLVDGADFLLWQRGGSPSPLSPSDLALWQSQYGMTFPLAAASAVPEPAGLTLLFVGLVGFAGGRRHRI